MLKWQHIKFADGSNSYICKTEEEFEKMKEKYNLVKLKENFWYALNTDLEEDLFYTEAVEVCPHCMSENIYEMWDTEKDGYIARCKHCGKEIFLCDECSHSEDNEEKKCDWCETECGGKCFRGIIKE